MINNERFVRGLADAVPQAFASKDVADEYDYVDYATEGDQAWVATIPLADVVTWLEAEAMAVDRSAQSVQILPGGHEPLAAFFNYMEETIAAAEDQSDRNWIMVELFEGVPWIEDVLQYLGPRTVALLRTAQRVLAEHNGWIGNWGD